MGRQAVTVIPPVRDGRRAARPPSIPQLVLLAASVAAGCLYLSGFPAAPGLRVLCKALPVLCLAAWTGRASPLVTAGLLASAAGDALLDAGAAWFAPGVAAFTAAHLFYIAAFTRADARRRAFHALPFVAWGAAAYAAVHSSLGGMRLPVAAYIGVICVMMWRAAAQAWPSPRTRLAWLGLAGALAFGASDTLIALSRWSSLLAPGWLIMALYWGGQALIAAWGRTKRPAG